MKVYSKAGTNKARKVLAYFTLVIFQDFINFEVQDTTLKIISIQCDTFAFYG